MFHFSGGLTQTDWLTGFYDVVSGGAAAATYNQNAYLVNCSLRQQQMYQEKNYKLSFVSTARDDIRKMMEISVNRVNNYMVVATLILGIASAFLQGAAFPIHTQDFIIYCFWANMCVSILHFALSVMFAIKAQNGAFLNTMRLLAWEFRPETPGEYAHNYMRQAFFFEKKGGLRELFRVPGLTEPRIPEENEKPRANSFCDNFPKGNFEKHGSRGPNAAPGWSFESPELENVDPVSRELSYLHRYGRYMNLWQPFDTRAKHCIGLGLISLSQGTGLFALGRLYDPQRTLSNVVGIDMVFIFTSITVLVSLNHFQPRSKFVLAAVMVAFFSFPLFCSLAFFIRSPYALHATFATLCPVSNCGLFLTGLYATTREHKTPREVTAHLTRGPAGQEFAEAENACYDIEKQQVVLDSELESSAATRAISQARTTIIVSLVFCFISWIGVSAVFVVSYTQGKMDLT